MKVQKEQAKDLSAESRREGPGPGKGNGADMRDWFESLEPALEFVLKRQEPLKTARFLDKLVERLR